MNTKHSAGAEVVDLDAVRRAHKAKSVGIRADFQRDAGSGKDRGYIRELADTITLQEGLRIAQGIVNKFSSKGALLRAFIERRKRRSMTENEEFHVVIMLGKKIAAGCSPDQLKALLVLYSRNQDEFYETYVVPAAEEFLRRFKKNVEEA